jgi:cell division protein ZapA
MLAVLIAAAERGYVMGQVSVTLNGRTYRLECGEGEETHLIALAEYLGSHVDTMKRKFGQVGDDRLILMASLLVTDELWELRRQMQELKSTLAEARRDRSVADESVKSVQSDLVRRIGAAADRLETLNERFGCEAQPVQQAPVRAVKRS